MPSVVKFFRQGEEKNEKPDDEEKLSVSSINEDSLERYSLQRFEESPKMYYNIY